MQSIYFTEEHELFRESLRDFIKLEITPFELEWEKTGKIDRRLFRKMGEMGFLGAGSGNQCTRKRLLH